MVLAAIACLTSGVSLVPQWSATLPAGLSQVHVLATAGSEHRQLAFSAIGGGKPSIYWFNSDTGECRAFPSESWAIAQYDCNLGLFSYRREDSTDTIDVSTGRRLSSIPAHGVRVGTLLPVPDFDERSTTFYDVRTGKVVAKRDSGTGDSKIQLLPYVGEPIWDTPKKRIFIVGKGNRSNDVKDIVEMKPGTFEILKRTFLSGFAMSFDGIRGNPETGPFVVYECTNRSRHPNGVYAQDLTRLEVDVSAVSDAGPHGLLVQKGSWPEFRDLKVSETRCFSPTGKLKWKSQRFLNCKWAGSYALSDRNVLDAATGQFLGSFDLPKGRFSMRWKDDWTFCFSSTSPPRIEAYRLKVGR